MINSQREHASMPMAVLVHNRRTRTSFKPQNQSSQLKEPTGCTHALRLQVQPGSKVRIWNLIRIQRIPYSTTSARITRTLRVLKMLLQQIVGPGYIGGLRPPRPNACGVRHIEAAKTRCGTSLATQTAATPKSCTRDSRLEFTLQTKVSECKMTTFLWCPLLEAPARSKLCFPRAPGRFACSKCCCTSLCLAVSAACGPRGPTRAAHCSSQNKMWHIASKSNGGHT
mmetsp:Transcript_42130/g.136354  ORF Transcript_42130/g.136354 Transcript_42130/m.136354 type:complete len:226 (+) Transcript_42130:186-863(+)